MVRAYGSAGVREDGRRKRGSAGGIHVGAVVVSRLECNGVKERSAPRNATMTKRPTHHHHRCLHLHRCILRSHIRNQSPALGTSNRRRPECRSRSLNRWPHNHLREGEREGGRAAGRGRRSLVSERRGLTAVAAAAAAPFAGTSLETHRNTSGAVTPVRRLQSVAVVIPAVYPVEAVGLDPLGWDVAVVLTISSRRMAEPSLSK